MYDQSACVVYSQLGGIKLNTFWNVKGGYLLYTGNKTCTENNMHSKRNRRWKRNERRNKMCHVR